MPRKFFRKYIPAPEVVLAKRWAAPFRPWLGHPNLWHLNETTIALRTDVPVDTELTIDYATHTGVSAWSMPCACGSAVCRGVVTGEDWRRPELRAAYGAHWTPPLLARIAASS